MRVSKKKKSPLSSLFSRKGPLNCGARRGGGEMVGLSDFCNWDRGGQTLFLVEIRGVANG